MSSSSPIVTLKTRGNAKFQAGDYAGAIELYTQTLGRATSTASVEDKRQIISNRAQAYFKWGDIYNALRDTELALSSEYTSTALASPPGVTPKCLWRKVKILNELLRWGEAQAAFDAFNQVSEEMGEPQDAEAPALQQFIAAALQLLHDDEEVVKSELLRALNTRGIVVEHRVIHTFPYAPDPPPGMEVEELGSVRFQTLDERPAAAVPDPLLTPLEIPVSVRAPGFKDPTRAGAPLIMRGGLMEEPPIPEGLPIGEYVDSLFTAFSMEIARDHSARRSLARYMPANGGVVLLMTQKGRLLVIPPETEPKDVWPRASWPRREGAPPPFENIQQTPTLRGEFEADGPPLMDGWMLSLVVLPGADCNAS